MSFIYNSWPRPGKWLLAAVELHLRAIQYAAGERGHRQESAQQFLTDEQSSGILLAQIILAVRNVLFLKYEKKNWLYSLQTL